MDKKSTRWAIETPSVDVNNALYLTLDAMQLAVETVIFPDVDPKKESHYAVEIRYKLIPLLAGRKIDLKKSGLKFVYHVWRKKGLDGRWELVDGIFKTKLSARAKEIKRWAEDRKKRKVFDPGASPPRSYQPPQPR